MYQQTLATINIRRRKAAFALFQGLHLIGVIVRNIPSDDHRAENTIVGFTHEMCSRHEIKSVGIEVGARISERIMRGYALAQQAFHQESVSIEEVPYAALLESYSSMPLTSRQRLRAVAKKVWPMLDNKKYGHCAFDAALLGLHVQARRMLECKTEAS